MVFSIRQYSELPTLKLRLYHDGRNDYRRFDEMLENSVITFSMKDQATGIYKIANKEARIMLTDPCDITGGSDKEYYIAYDFTSEDTEKPGIYIGEFKIIFLNSQLQPNGSLIVPISEELYIHILDSFVKSDINYIN
jgi:hypothetical protein